MELTSNQSKFEFCRKENISYINNNINEERTNVNNINLN